MRRNFFVGIIALVVLGACKNESPSYTSFSLPEAGSRFATGAIVQAKLDIATGNTSDSIVYFLDSTKISVSKDTAAITFETMGMRVGNHLLSAKIYKGGIAEDVTTNIVLLAAKPPKIYTYSVVNTYPHLTSSYTQGLEFRDGYLYESTGQNAESKLLKINLTTGQPVQEVKLADEYFGEGLTIVGDKIVQLTWTQNIGFVYDKSTLKKLAEFPYVGREGWGLAFDGTRVLNSSGSSSIYYLDKEQFATTGSFEVYDHNGPVDALNELEFIDGMLYANIYKTDGPYADKIVIINPASGAVEGAIDLKGLNPEPAQTGNTDYILNGIAWDKAGKRLFVTGKKWSKLFEIKVVGN